MAGERHHQPYGILHGGVYASIVEDVASNGAGQASMARGQRGIVGVSNHTDSLGTTASRRSASELWEVLITRASDDVFVSRGQVRFQVLDELPGGLHPAEGTDPIP